MSGTRGHNGSQHSYKKEHPSHCSLKRVKQNEHGIRRKKVRDIINHYDIIDLDTTLIPTNNKKKRVWG